MIAFIIALCVILFTLSESFSVGTLAFCLRWSLLAVAGLFLIGG